MGHRHFGQKEQEVRRQGGREGVESAGEPIVPAAAE